MIKHLHEREKALERFGWKGREAEWIALVCLHSGVFTRAQFCYFFDAVSDRKRAFRFVRDLVDRGLAVEDALPNKRGRAKACRISSKEIYRALGIENVRHRPDADDSLMLRRLLSLDYVLEHPQLPWLPTEQEKVAFFDLLGFDRRRLPHRLYHGANGIRPVTLPSNCPSRLMPKPPPSPTSIRADIPTPNCDLGARRMSGFGELCGCTASRSAPL